MTATQDQNFPREEKIRQILEQEIREGEDLADEARRMIKYLLLEKKGYAFEDVRSNVTFDVVLGSEPAASSVDFLVSVNSIPAMIVKCAAGSLDSRQRQAVAAARVIASPPARIAVVADPLSALVLDVSTGKVIGEGFGAIPVKEQLNKIIAEQGLAPLSDERIEKEKRILLAFDAIKCCVPKGKDGGVKLDDMCKGK